MNKKMNYFGNGNRIPLSESEIDFTESILSVVNEIGIFFLEINFTKI